LLETFPTLMDDLQDVNKANVLLDETTKVNKDLKAERAAESVVARLALKEYEDPAIAIKDALAEKRPEKSIVEFIRSIKNADRDVVEALIKQDPVLRRKNPQEVLNSGLKSSFIKMALLDGGGPFNAEFRADRAYESLFEPIKYGRGKTSLMDILVQQKVFDKTEANNIKAMLSQLLEFEAKDAAGQLDLELGKAPNPALDFWLRVSGAAAGARLQKMLPGDAQAGSLVAAGAGSKYFRQLFQEIPASMHLKAMGDLMQDPQALALFLKKAKDGQEGAGIARSLARWFVDRGYMTAARGVPFLNRESELFEEFFQDEEQPAAQPAPQPAPQQPAVPPVTEAPAPRPEVVVSQQQPRPTARPLQTSMAPPAPQGGKVNPQTAARLSAAFPEDEILAMANPTKSGIGSLMG